MDENFERTDELVRVERDEVPRDTSMAALAELKPVAREDGLHTAGTSSQIADGAAAVLMMSATKAKELGLKPLATIRSSALVGCDPVIMLEGPIPATEKMLDQTGLSIDDIDVFEVNEAFASVVLSWAKEVGATWPRSIQMAVLLRWAIPRATGCFLITKAVYELKRSGGRWLDRYVLRWRIGDWHPDRKRSLVQPRLGMGGLPIPYNRFAGDPVTYPQIDSRGSPSPILSLCSAGPAPPPSPL